MIYMKKIISTIVIIFLICFLATNIKLSANNLYDEYESKTIIQQVTENLFGDVIIESVEDLYNLDDSPDYLYVKFVDSGYAIYSSQTLDLLEYSLNSTLPYSGVNKKYYAGPANYFIKINNQYENLTTKTFLSNDEKNTIVEQSKTVLLAAETNTGKLRKNNNLSFSSKINSKENENIISNSNEIDSSTNSGENEIPAAGISLDATYIENYEYFITGPHHGKNRNGTCSAVAAQILLGYHNYYSDRRIIDNKYLFSGEDGPNTCANPMKISSEIIGTRGIEEEASGDSNNYFSKIVDDIPIGSNTNMISNGISQILKDRSTELGINNSLANVSVSYDLELMKNEIDAGRPIIISMKYTSYINHAVVAYGYQTLGGTGTTEDEQFGYIAHFGWGEQGNWTKSSNVWVNQAWCNSFVKMEVGHSHEYGNPTGDYYECVCSCGHRISKFPFTTDISDGKLTITDANFESPNDFIIPSKIDSYPVVNIAPNAFSNHNNIKNLKIPNSVENIGLGAFSGCTFLEKITLPFIGESVNSSNAFSNFGYIFGTNSYLGSSPTIQSGNIYYIPSSLKEVVITNTTVIKNKAFENCNNISKITLPHGLNNIEDYAFLNCSSLKDINIPQTVHTIGDNSFECCSSLKSLIIPYSVTSIGVDAFPNDISLTWHYNPIITASDLRINEVLKSVEINTGVTKINNDAFKDCYNLTKVVVKENVSYIGTSSFDGCTSLESVTWYYNSNYTASQLGEEFTNLLTDVEILNGVIKINDNAFRNCVNLKSVSISQSVVEVGENVFFGCNLLNSLEWYYNPQVSAVDLKIQNLLTSVIFVDQIGWNKIDSISSDAFIGCTKLNHLSIPSFITNVYSTNNSKLVNIDLSFVPSTTYVSLFIPNEINEIEIKKIANGCFDEWNNLVSITIPNSVTSIEARAFNNCTNLNNVTLSTNLTSIENYTFNGCNKLKSIVIPKSVTSIGVSAFKDCTKLTNVKLSSNLTTIESNCFENCENLTSIIIPNSVTSIGASAFKNCTNLTNITLSNQLTKIESNCFENCENLTSIIIPNSVTCISATAFKDCTNLANITLSNQLTSIEDNCFEGFHYLTSIIIPDSVTSIGTRAFKNCTNLTNITLSNQLTTIESNCFENCENISDIIIPDSVTSIGASAFKNCNKLMIPTLSKSLIKIGDSAFKGCERITSIVIPDSVVNIESSAFENCITLRVVTLSNNLTTIGNSAFKGCEKLKKISIPYNVVDIGENAFENCTWLEMVTVLRNELSITNIGENAFDNCSEGFKIIVPQFRYVTYINATNWNEYSDIIEPNIPFECLSLDCLTINKEFLKDQYTGIYKVTIDCTRSYKFSSVSDVEMTLYDDLMNVISSEKQNLTRYLTPGIYYFDVNFDNNENNEEIIVNYGLTWPSDGTLIYLDEINNINSLHLRCDDTKHGLFSFYNDQGAGFYKILLESGNNSSYSNGMIKIYSDNLRSNLLKRYNVNDVDVEASSKLNENEMYVYLPDIGYYYIDILMYNDVYSNITLLIERVEENVVDYSNELDSTCFDVIFESKTSLSYFEKVTISHRSKIELDIITSGIFNDSIPVFVFEELLEEGYEPGNNHYYLETNFIDEITYINRGPVFTLILDPGTYYMGYYNNMDNVSIYFSLRRIVDYIENAGSILVADPYYEGYELGSEVNFNNGVCDDYTITEGFTRNIYLMVNDRLSDPMSRLDYDWYSSDENIATVTKYGTVLGLPVNSDTEVTIYAVLKSNPSVVYYKTFTILNDLEDESVIIECSMSYSYSRYNGKYKLELNNSNSAYPMIQYYYWNIINNSDESVSMDYWGYITSTGPTCVIMEGTYELNPRVKLYITLFITE